MIAVLDFGMGNIHSCLKAISRYTDSYKLVDSPEDLKNVSGIILPGDGAFEKAMKNLEAKGFVEAVTEKVNSGVPVFGICIGYQLLFQDSDETTKEGMLVNGFGFLKGRIRRFKGKKLKVPHMGWNRLVFENKKQNKILQGISNGTYMYFIHSYRPIEVEFKAVVASCSYYEEKFPVVVEKENIFGTQFHPEKSDRAGLKILENFIELTKT
ncbi:MAG: imidazole glycerol phosphate synthase subunit HisH [Leptospiraceae bacterium]|nr:imidazole glycerol phosphate synthase subunit HisH [Leptospiraceae bacterium]